MKISIESFLTTVKNSPETITFQQTMTIIDEFYGFHETAFSNGTQQNAKGENSGSCKVFSFAQLHDLNQQQSLALFGDYYRHDVLLHPDAEDHQNIRQFMQHGFAGLDFENQALLKKDNN